jgi:hypothetical protein
MGLKRTLPVYPLITAGVMTGTAVLTSVPTNIQNLDNIALQVSWTGTPTGVLQVLCSLDGVTYSPLVFSPALTQPAGSSGAFNVSINQCPFPLLEVQYTNTSGTGVLSVQIFAKDVN